MMNYIFKRVAMLIPTFFGITMITFFMIQLAPGDPVSLTQNFDGGVKNQAMAESIINETKKQYGLDQPIWVQYGRWVKKIVTLEFGESYVDRRPVIQKIKEALPITLVLNGLSIFLVYLIAVPIGVACAMHPRGWLDRFSAVLGFVFYALPSFWVATLLIIYLGGGDFLNLFPIAGYVSIGAEGLSGFEWVINVLWHLALPVFCLTYGGVAFLSRFSKTTMLDVIKKEFMRTARAKGLTRWQAVWRHGFRNSLMPLVTLTGMILPALLGGSVIIEQLFSIPGMGKLGFEAVLSRDYTMVMAIAIINAFLTLISFLITDILYGVVDPRVSYD